MVNRNIRGSVGNSCPKGRYTAQQGCGCDGVKQLMAKLQAVDFSLIDTVLYLDAYPHCKKAMEYYHKLLKEKDMLSAELMEAGIPLTNMSNTGEHWKWTDGPWPWEYEANI